MENTTFTIRVATPRDIPQLAKIEAACFAQPWSETAFSDSMAQKNTLFLCAATNGIIAAYIGLYLAFDEAEVTNIATLPAYRRMGLAKTLLCKTEETLTARGVTALHLDVRVSNVAAKTLYRSMGFSEDGIRRSFYSLPREDACLMTKQLIPRENP